MSKNNEVPGQRKTRITNNPIDHGYPPEVDAIASDPTVRKNLKLKPQESIEKLEALRVKYPDVPVLYNYLSVAYEEVGNAEKSNELVEQCYKLFPNYLWGQCSYVGMLFFVKHNHEAFNLVFGGKLDLCDVSPNREMFHVSEAILFYYMLGYHFAFHCDFAQASHMLSIIKKLDKNSYLVICLENYLNFLKTNCGITFSGKNARIRYSLSRKRKLSE